MTMPGPNALHWQQPKILDVGSGLCYGPDVVVKRLLCGLAGSFGQLNPVSPIDLGEFGEKIKYCLVFGWDI